MSLDTETNCVIMTISNHKKEYLIMTHYFLIMPTFLKRITTNTWGYFSITVFYATPTFYIYI